MTRITEDDLEAAILADLAEIQKPQFPDLRPDEVTIGRMCAILHDDTGKPCSKEKAGRAIDDLVAAGKLAPVDTKWRRNPDTGKDVLAWRRTK